MAGNKINIDLSVQDQSSTIKQRTNDAKQLNNELEKAQRLMTGTKSGSRAMRASYGGVAGGEVEEYNRARGAAGVGGASARDFADQARGLGGLVRLYATYAANIFAVTAAFSALREAMQTDIMVKGLQQLSAASGTSMGSLAKQFSDVTDGAISFRESMQATAKAVSSGLSSSQFIELGKVAKGASQALGLDMSDAVSRLTRGITKLEPELLDELGLFTKTGKAAEEYARKVGKTEAQLTDFERRQAFANAVLEEGRQKFGEIAQAGNPYDKLLAQLKDVAQSILSTVNSIITPIAKLLADNTGLIGAAIALAAIKITKQAIPALTSWQAGLKDAAKAAKDRMGDVNEAFQGVFYSKTAAAAGIPELEKQLKAAQQSLTKSVTDKRTLESSSFKQVTTAKELSDKDRLKLAKDIDKYETSTVKHRQDQVAAAKEVLRIDSEIKNIRNQLNAAYDKTNDQMDKQAKFGSAIWQREQLTRAARQRYAELEIRSRVAENVDTMGVRGAVQELYKETAASKDLSKMGKFKTVTLGTLAAVTRGIEIAASAFSRFFFVIGAAVAVFQVLDSIFSKNNEQTQALNKSLDILNDTTQTAKDTADKYKDSISGDAIIAFSNSLDELTQSLKNVTKGFIEAQEAAGYWDFIWDRIKDVTPFVDSLQESTSKSIGKSLVAAIKSVPEGPMRDELSQKFFKTLKLGDTALVNTETFTNALKGLDAETYGKVIQQLGVDQAGVNEKFKESTIYLRDLESSTEAATKAQQAFNNSLKDTSPVAQFFRTSISLADTLSKALKQVDFNAQLGALDKLSKVDLTIFDPSVALEIAKQVNAYKDAAPRYKELTSIAADAEKEVARLNQMIIDSQIIDPFTGLVYVDPKLQKSVSEVEDTLNKAKKAAEDLKEKTKQIANETQLLIEKSVGATIARSLDAFSTKLRQAVVEQQKYILSKFPVSTEAGIQLSNKLAKEQIDLDFKLINSQEMLSASQDLLRIQIQRLADIEELKNLPKTAENIPRAVKLAGRIGEAGRAEELFSGGTLAELRSAAIYNPALYALVERRQKLALAQQQKGIKSSIEDFNTALADIALAADDKIKVLNTFIKGLENSINSVVTDTEYGIGTKSVMLLQLAEIQRKKLVEEGQKQVDIAIRTGRELVSTAKGDTNKTLAQEAANELERRARLESQINLELFDQSENIRQVNQNNQDYLSILDIKYQKLDKELALQRELRNLETLRLDNRLKLEEELLGQADRFKILTDDQIRNQRKRIQEQRIERELANNLFQLQESRAQAARDAVKSGGIGDDSGAATPQQIRASEAYALELDRLSALEKQYKLTAEGQRQLLEAQNQFTLREEAYADAFVRSFDRMTDAVVEFTKTGKLNFKNLINSFLEDLLRFEVKTAMQQTLSSLGGGMGLAKTVLGRVGLASGKQTPETMLQPKGTEGDPLYVSIVGPSISSYTGLGRQPGKPAPIVSRDSPDFYTGRQFEADLPTPNTSELLAANRIPFIVSGAEGPFIYTDVRPEQKTFEEKKFEVLGSKVTRESLVFGERWAEAVTPSIERVSENLKRSFTVNPQALADSMIEGFEGGFQGLASIVQRTALQAGGSLLGGLFKSLLGGGGGYGSAYDALLNPGLFGGVFAKGGSLSSGEWGIAGEAGPEIVTGPATVYPMQNTSQGKVEVVVNNYSNASAETRETTDSRGNRRIEVIVGEMVAGEMSRSNSAVQQSLTNNFGARPMVARR
jgi:hypothetical protein